MDDVAKLNQKERAELFEQTVSQRGFHPTIAEKDFWEKATILHQQCHRASALPSGYSQHYYDLYQLAESNVKSKALFDLELLADVVKFKRRFYRSSWANYETAKPPTFRLIPDERLQY